MEGWMEGWVDGWKGGRTDGWMDGRVDGWMGGWMHGRWMEESSGINGNCITYLFFCLSLLYHIPPDFDTWGQDRSGEICHINSHEVANFLSRWMEKRSILSASQKCRLGKEGKSHGISVVCGYTVFPSMTWNMPVTTA